MCVLTFWVTSFFSSYSLGRGGALLWVTNGKASAIVMIGLVGELAKLPTTTLGRGFSGGNRKATLDGSIPPRSMSLRLLLSMFVILQQIQVTVQPGNCSCFMHFAAAERQIQPPCGGSAKRDHCFFWSHRVKVSPSRQFTRSWGMIPELSIVGTQFAFHCGRFCTATTVSGGTTLPTTPAHLAHIILHAN